MRRLVRRSPDGDHFWFGESRYGGISLWWGCGGTEGARHTEHFRDVARADSELARLATERIAEGYVELGDDVAVSPEGQRTLARVLADAVADDPDDLAACMAEADYLAEQGDPRGEFVQVQLALEDDSRSPAERDSLKSREAQLLAAHEAAWLGDLAPLLIGSPESRRAAFLADLTAERRARAEAADYDNYPEGANVRYSWARGRLDAFECENLTVNAVRRLGSHPLARCLRVLSVDDDRCASGDCLTTLGHDVPTLDWFRPVEMLATHPASRNVRAFRFGRIADPEAETYDVGTQLGRLSVLLAAMPRLEELSLLGHWRDYDDEAEKVFSLSTLDNLRVLLHYHGIHYPLEVLADNPALANLTRLLCFPHSFAQGNDYDGGPTLNLARLTAVARSPHLRSLTHLQLRCCDAGDAGVEELIASGLLGRLKWLDLRHGHVTDEGARMLAACDDARRLESLDLVNNRLTPDGVEALRRAGIRARTESQQVTPYQDDRIMYYGDSE